MTTFLVRSAVIVRQRRWRKAAFLGGWLAVVTLTLGGLFLLAFAREMDAFQHYSWDGWYWITLFGVTVCGMLIWLGYCARAINYGARRGAGRLLVARSASRAGEVR
jgi:hypothetical protein